MTSGDVCASSHGRVSARTSKLVAVRQLEQLPIVNRFLCITTRHKRHSANTRRTTQTHSTEYKHTAHKNANRNAQTHNANRNALEIDCLRERPHPLRTGNLANPSLKASRTRRGPIAQPKTMHPPREGHKANTQRTTRAHVTTRNCYLGPGYQLSRRCRRGSR